MKCLIYVLLIVLIALPSTTIAPVVQDARRHEGPQSGPPSGPPSGPQSGPQSSPPSGPQSGPTSGTPSGPPSVSSSSSSLRRPTDQSTIAKPSTSNDEAIIDDSDNLSIVEGFRSDMGALTKRLTKRCGVVDLKFCMHADFLRRVLRDFVKRKGVPSKAYQRIVAFAKEEEEHLKSLDERSRRLLFYQLLEMEYMDLFERWHEKIMESEKKQQTTSTENRNAAMASPIGDEKSPREQVYDRYKADLEAVLKDAFRITGVTQLWCNLPHTSSDGVDFRPAFEKEEQDVNADAQSVAPSALSRDSDDELPPRHGMGGKFCRLVIQISRKVKVWSKNNNVRFVFSIILSAASIGITLALG